MPWKDINKRREAIRKHYYNNRQIYIDKAAKQREELRECVRKLKGSTPCADCRVKYPFYVMDFDHLNNKKMLVSRAVLRGNWKQAREEIAKCEIVCSNCHRQRTYKRL